MMGRLPGEIKILTLKIFNKNISKIFSARSLKFDQLIEDCE